MQPEATRGSDVASTLLSPDRWEREQVEEFVQNLVRAIRTHQIYEGSGPVYDRFLQALHQRVGALWEQMPELQIDVTEDALLWDGVTVHEDEERSGGLSFLLYRDGLRSLTFLAGFGGEEMIRLLELFARAARLGNSEADDLVTLLWDLDLRHLRHAAVDTLAEGAEPTRTGEATAATVAASAIREEAAQPAPAGLSTADFDETLYFLEDAELRHLAEEVDKEARRDVWTDVVNALLDRLEDGDAERQERIAAILVDILPGMLAAGRFGMVTALLRELTELATRPGLLPVTALKMVHSLFAQLAQPSTVREMVRSVDEPPDIASAGALAELLVFLPPEALGPLLRAAEETARPEVKRLLAPAIEQLVTRSPDRVVRLLAHEDPVLAGAAARWAGRLRLENAAAPLVSLLRHDNPVLRLAAVEALRELRTSVGAGALQTALDDADRDVRIAAARSLAALAYTGARGRLADAVQSKQLREGDLTEQIAVFQAFGSVADPAGVAMLARMLNGKNWLGRHESSEVRACAAEALGRSRLPAARDALEAAAGDADAVVRSAVSRAIREGTA